MRSVTQEKRREEILAPFASRLRLMVSDPSAAPTKSLTIGSQTLALETWERMTLARAVAGRAGGPEWAPLLVDGTALQVKVLTELDELARGGMPAATMSLIRHQLMLDAAIGLALSRESQQAVDRLVLGGKLDEAKKLSAFRTKLSHTIKSIRGKLSNEAMAEAEQLSAEMSAPEKTPPRPAGTPPGSSAPPRPVPSGFSLPEVDPSRFAQTDEQAEARRLELLRPFIAQLELLQSKAGDGASSFERNRGAASLELNEWEENVLERVLSGTAGEAQRWPALILQGVAFQDKYRCAVEQLDDPSGLDEETRERTERQLVLGAALGLALTEELQRAMDDLVADNRLEEAKRLSAFRNRLIHSLKALRNRMGNGAFDVARELSAEAVVHRNDQTVSAPVPQQFFDRSEDFGDDRPAARPRAVRAAEETSDRTKPLVLVLGLLLVIWAVFILPRLTREKLPELLAQDVPQLPAVQQVVSRPPSMFVTVDRKLWDELPRAERRLFVDKLGKTASKAEYTGVHVKADDGSTVAQWLRDTGVTVFDLSD